MLEKGMVTKEKYEDTRKINQLSILHGVIGYGSGLFEGN